MHIHKLETWKHSHHFTQDESKNEKKTLRVVILTGLMMVIEIIAGWVFGSMALLADGWHMGTHAAALGITLFAYWYARRQADNPRLSAW
jgi:Co/Zn/Cd efflux system component